MASKRNLKKDFAELSITIYSEALLSKIINKDSHKVEEIDNVIDEIIVWTDDTFRRISHTDGAKNPKLVKKYYKELKEDIAQKADNILEKIFNQ